MTYTVEIDTDKLDELAEFALQETEQLTKDTPEKTHSACVKSIREKADAYGLEYLNHGSNRIAFQLPDGNVVKISTHSYYRSGTEQTRVEVLIWNALQKQKETHSFMPILEHDPDFKWLVMPHAEHMTDNNEVSDEEKITAIYRNYPYLSYDAEFLLSENIGWHNSRYLIVDYGSFIPRSFIEQELPHGYTEKIGEENIA